MCARTARMGSTEHLFGQVVVRIHTKQVKQTLPYIWSNPPTACHIIIWHGIQLKVARECCRVTCSTLRPDVLCFYLEELKGKSKQHKHARVTFPALCLLNSCPLLCNRERFSIIQPAWTWPEFIVHRLLFPLFLVPLSHCNFWGWEGRRFTN